MSYPDSCRDSRGRVTYPVASRNSAPTQTVGSTTAQVPSSSVTADDLANDPSGSTTVSNPTSTVESSVEVTPTAPTTSIDVHPTTSAEQDTNTAKIVEPATQVIGTTGTATITQTSRKTIRPLLVNAGSVDRLPSSPLVAIAGLMAATMFFFN